ncbi:hypothetical protein PG996_012290 [Apiospora saccharicola]|uniref:Uncharacterized protein n=1 Tax=Apiospora saccharicola TaxID=335842 RepID=A0ABR1U256_9PEZI
MYFFFRMPAPELPMAAADPIVISDEDGSDTDPIVISDTDDNDADDSDGEIIMLRPVVRPAAVPQETSDADDSDVEPIMARPVVRPVAVAPDKPVTTDRPPTNGDKPRDTDTKTTAMYKTSSTTTANHPTTTATNTSNATSTKPETDSDTSDTEDAESDTGESESDIEDAESTIEVADSDSEYAYSDIEESYSEIEDSCSEIEDDTTSMQDSPRPAQVIMPSAKANEKPHKTILGTSKSHTERGNDTDGAPSNRGNPNKPEVASGKVVQAPKAKAADGVYLNTRSAKRKFVDDDPSSKETDMPTGCLSGFDEKDIVEMFQNRRLWRGKEELHQLSGRLAATRDATLKLLQQFQTVLNMWAEPAGYMKEARVLLPPLNQAWDDWVIFDYRLVTFRDRVRDALARKSRRVPLGFWVPNELQRRAVSIPGACKTLDELACVVKELICGAAFASLRIGNSDGGRTRRNDSVSAQLKQLEFLVGELKTS